MAGQCTWVMSTRDPHGDGDPPRPPRRPPPRLVIALLIIAVCATIGGSLAAVLNSGHQPPAAVRGGTRPGTPDEQAVYARIEPSVVDVTSTLQYENETAEGTGFVINAHDGLVLTNNHVIRDATRVTATLPVTGKTYQARIVGDDPGDDVAVIQLRGASGLTAASLGNSSRVMLGTPVLAIGNEAGQGGPPAIAPGVINSLDRTIKAGDRNSSFTETLHDMLQTSAQIAPGDSGGPLADSAGQVIGVDTAASSPSAGGAVSGFAIPINTAIAIASRIGAGRGGTGIIIGIPGFLGVLVPVSAKADPRDQIGSAGQAGSGSPARKSGCQTSVEGVTAPARVAPARSGALVEGVLCGTSAATAGIVPGDVITKVAGQAVTSPDSLTRIMSVLRPGTTVPVTWVSLGGPSSTEALRLGPAPAR